MTVRVDVPTPDGPARLHLDEPSGAASATLVLGHGAGGGSDARDLAALAAGLPAHGIAVVRVDQPWRVAGRRVAPAPATLDRCWTAVLPHVPVAGRLILGGRSAGARVACRTATALGADGVLALAFPLHPPGRPATSRAAELDAGVPLLVLQGERDPFGAPAEFPPGVEVRAVPGADHGLKVGVRADPGQAEVLAALVAHAEEWIRGMPRRRRRVPPP